MFLSTDPAGLQSPRLLPTGDGQCSCVHKTVPTEEFCSCRCTAGVAQHLLHKLLHKAFDSAGWQAYYKQLDSRSAGVARVL